MTVTVESGNGGWSEYTLSRKKLKKGAKLIAGDIALGDAICQSTDYKSGQYFRLVISFKPEENVTPKRAREIVKEFMKHLLHGYSNDEFHLDIVEHTDTENLHYHIRVPKLNLFTGTQLHYHYLSDIDRKDKIHQYLEIKHDLLSPLEEKGIKPSAGKKAKQIQKWRKEHGQEPFVFTKKKDRDMAKERMFDFFSDAIKSGYIESFEEVIAELEAMGLTIAKVDYDRTKKFDYITIENDTGKLRLQGEIYGRKFYEHSGEDRAAAIASGGSLEARNRYDRPSLEQAEAALERANKQRSKFLEARFRTARERALSSHQAPSPSDRAGDRDRGRSQEEKRKDSERSVRHKRELHRSDHGKNKVLGEIENDRNRNDIIGRVREARKRAEARNRSIREQTESDLRRIREQYTKIDEALSGQLDQFNEQRNGRRQSLDRLAEEFIEPTEEDYRAIEEAAQSRGHSNEVETHLAGLIQYFGKQFIRFKQRIDAANRSLVEGLTGGIKALEERVVMEELNRFKREINLAEYAQSFGYAVDRKKSTKISPVLKKDGDTLIVGQSKADGHYIYFNANNDSDRGSIIDFVKNRTGETLGHIRKRLRNWLNIPQPQVERVEVKPAALDEIELQLAKDNAVAYWDSIEEKKLFTGDLRHIPSKYLVSENVDDVKFDGNQWYFALRDADQEICGVEIRNKEGKNARLASGHKKGIFAVGGFSADHCKKIILTESTIDAKSAEVIAGGGTYWSHTFISIGGNAGIVAERALKKLCSQLPNAIIIIATDNDEAGDKHAQRLMNIIGNDREYERFRPTEKDLNDDLPKFKAEQVQKQQRTQSRGIRR